LAHVYCADGAAVELAATHLRTLDGIARVYAGAERAQLGLDHSRSGELVALAADGAWFAYDYWLDDQLRPDFANCVEIHKKPGYDPRELFFDPRGGKRRAAWALLRKSLGLRYVMDPVPLDSSLVRGSHGRPAARSRHGPVIIGSEKAWARQAWSMLDVAPLVTQLLLE
jgi:hypothetical protein